MNALSNSQVITALGIPNDVATAVATASGSTFTAAANQVIDTIVNKIVYQKFNKVTFRNPFKQFDSYPVTYGDTIEKIHTDPVDGEVEDASGADADPFSAKVPTAHTLYPSINYMMRYGLKVPVPQLRRAMLNEYGLQELVNELVRQLSLKRDVDEYLATIIMLNNKDLYANGFEDIDVTNASGPSEQMKIVTDKMVNVYKDMQIYSYDNNKMKVNNVSSPEDCYLVIKQDVLNSINLDFLSGVWNLDKIDLIKHIIPVRSFKAVVNTTNKQGQTATITASEKGDDIDFVILDKNGFDCHVALEDTGSIYNPKNLAFYYWSHLWKIISYDWSFQARAFKIKKSAV